MTSFSGPDPELDPELAELLQLEELERSEAGFMATKPQGDEFDPDLAELMRMAERDMAGDPGGYQADPELEAELLRLEAEERGENPF